MEDKHYFLFGKEAAKAHLDGQSIEQVIKHDCTIFCYDDRYDYPEDILSAFVGWGDYAVISEEEYEQFKQHTQQSHERTKRLPKSELPQLGN